MCHGGADVCHGGADAPSSRNSTGIQLEADVSAMTSYVIRVERKTEVEMVTAGPAQCPTAIDNWKCESHHPSMQQPPQKH